MKYLVVLISMLLAATFSIKGATAGEQSGFQPCNPWWQSTETDACDRSISNEEVGTKSILEPMNFSGPAPVQKSSSATVTNSGEISTSCWKLTAGSGFKNIGGGAGILSCSN